MSNTKTGGPAFPSHGSMGEVAQEGMTMRDYFAAKAMAVVMPMVVEEIRKRSISEADTTKLKLVSAEACYGIADAMLKAREA